MINVECSYFIRPLEKPFSGDAACVIKTEKCIYCFLFDVLGHGKEAWESAEICVDIVREHYNHDFVHLAEIIHKRLKKDHLRGTVAGFCKVNTYTGSMSYLAFGDVALKLFGKNKTDFIPFRGIIGEVYRTPAVRDVSLSEGDIVILHSDGVHNLISERQYPGLLTDSADVAAKSIVDLFGRETDDASCIVLKVKT
ncbi:SpoIIE family protein phosphatase [bacterium]|nr:SpoIIE family protein phosphatase [bacterium]